MVFTNRCGLIIAALLLAACSQTPSQSTDNTDAVVDDNTKQSVDIAVADKKPQPNPYLVNPPSVSQKAKRLFNQALAAMQNKQWAQAEVLLQDMQTNYPSLAGVQVNLGIVYRQTDRLPQAIEVLNSAINTNPDNFDAYNELAILHRSLGEFERAETLYKKALKRWDAQPVIHRNLGILYELYMGRTNDALLHYEQAQLLLDTPDKKLAGWIKDVKRRLAKAASRQGNKS